MKKMVLVLLLSLFAQAKELVATLHVDGMTCPLCTTAIKKSLKSIDGVKSAKVILNSQSATVVFDAKVSKEELLKAVEKVGYSASIESIN